jgi:hypothetical protein
MRENLLNLSTTPRSAVLIVKNEPSSAPRTIKTTKINRIRMIIEAGLSMALSYSAAKSSHKEALEIKTGAA